MHFWKWWDKYFSMRCIYYQWNVVHKLCIACNLFYPPIESKTITVFIQSKQFEILQHQPRLLYTHRSKTFLRNDLWAIRFIFNVIVLYEYKRWICCWDFYYSQLCVQNNRITSLNSVRKATWTTFCTLFKHNFWSRALLIMVAKKVRYWIHCRVSFRRSNAPIQRETTSHTKIVNSYAWTIIIHTFSL